MTLVCGFFGHRHCPVLIGDLLVSNFVSGNAQRVAVPSIGKLAEVAPEWGDHPISGLSQKLVVISQNLVLGWSGSLIHARTLLRDLKKESLEISFDFDSLSKYLDKYKDANLDEIQLTGFLLSGNQLKFVGWNCSGWGEKSNPGGLICGSATSNHENIRHIIDSFKAKIPDDPQVNAGYLGCVLGLSVAGNLMMDDMLGAESLHTYLYGGGFEVASYGQGGFYKIGKIGYMYWDCLIDGTNSARLWPVQLFSIDYENDSLLLRVMRFEWADGADAPSLKQHDLFSVSPFLGDSIRIETPQKLPSLDFNAVANICLIRPNVEGKQRRFIMLTAGSIEGRRLIEFVERDGRLYIEMNENFVNYFIKGILGQETISLVKFGKLD